MKPLHGLAVYTPPSTSPYSMAGVMITRYEVHVYVDKGVSRKTLVSSTRVLMKDRT